jgi:5,5'-dehydrodivanillate O-demethylase
MKTEENVELTRVGRDTPAGRMLRRYWHPVGISDDLTNTPKLVKLLGEELVLFRKPDGSCGLLGSKCPHRGAALAAGTVEAEGLRCPYHGWLFSSSGACLQQPCEPADSRFKERIVQPNYPVQEIGGLVFTYLGPLPAPELPRVDMLVDSNGRRRACFARYVPVNWLQMVDNHMDPTHTTWLHSQMQPWQEAPECHYFDTQWGAIALAARRGAERGTRYVREVHFIMPNGLKVPIPDNTNTPLASPSTLRYAWVVPMDDYNTVEFEVLFAPFDADGQPTRFKYDADSNLYDMPAPKPYDEYINPGNPSFPDYENSGAKGTTVVLRQDTLIQASQGTIQPREDEHLATSDRGVIKLRRIIKEGIDAVAKGEDPRGIIRQHPEDGVARIEVAEEVISDTEFDELMAHQSLAKARKARADAQVRETANGS